VPPPGSRRARTASVLATALLICACGSGGETQRPASGGAETAAGEGATGSPGAPSPGDREGHETPSLQTGFRLLRQGDLKGAEPHLTAALRDTPRDRRILEALGSIYARTDRFKQAEESFHTALAVEPASNGALLGLAAVYVETGRYDEAAATLTEVRRRDPGNLVARLKGALLHVRLGRAEEAAAGAREVIARQPGNAEAHYVLGLALERKGSLDEAVAEMRRVHDLSPTHLRALDHLLIIEARRGRSVEAARWRKAQQETLFRAHGEERVRNQRIDGVAAFNREDYRTALREFQEISREDPGDPQVHLHLGSTHIALGNLDEAKRELEHCLALDPRNDRALAELGRAHALANRLDEAIETLRKAVAVNPQFAEPHFYLAGIYRARGEQDRFREEMKIFSELQARSQGSALDVLPERRP